MEMMVDLSMVTEAGLEGAGAGEARLASTGMTSRTRYSEGGAAWRRKGSVVTITTKETNSAMTPL